MSVHPSAIDALLARARRDLDRVEPQQLANEIAAGALTVDIRPADQRRRDGELPGAIVIDRNVLEWRPDPDHDQSEHDAESLRFMHSGSTSSQAAAGSGI